MGDRAQPRRRVDRAVNTLDLILLLVAVPAAVGGWRLGLVARASSWLGMALGLLAASRFAPDVVEAVDAEDSALVLLVAATVLVLGAFAGQLVGLVAGSRLRVAVPGATGQAADRFLGGVTGVLGVVVAAWLLLPIMEGVETWPAEQVRTSFVAEAVGDVLPEPPDTLAGLAGLVGEARWLDIIDDFSADVRNAPPPPELALAGPVDAHAFQATVKVDGEACGELHEGSGFVVAGDLVVTNAHVVAGMPAPSVTTFDGRRLETQIVAFDASRDLAVLQPVGGPTGLDPLAEGTADEDHRGVVYGYPAGNISRQPYEIFRVETVRIADLYGGGQGDREVFFLAAQLAQGDSGAPLVSPQGEVVGVAFATSESGDDRAFAVSNRELASALAEVRQGLVVDPGHVEPLTKCLAAEERF
ncbi:MAG: MarP family serine protease [Acidimicrobiia bacterium]|nr:MarP family serine protease [Acidimicrobiia bacterium]